MGLTDAGKVKTSGHNGDGQCSVYGDEWTDIIAISAGDWHTVGLKSDGTVVATGSLYSDKPSGVSDVEDWENIVAIDASTGYTLGLTADGTIKVICFVKIRRDLNQVHGPIFLVPDEWDTVNKILG